MATDDRIAELERLAAQKAAQSIISSRWFPLLVGDAVAGLPVAEMARKSMRHAIGKDPILAKAPQDCRDRIADAAAVIVVAEAERQAAEAN